MKYLIHSAIIVVLVLISSIILVMYYTQDFEYNLDFKDSIKFSEIDFESRVNQWEKNTNMLVKAQTEIGELNVDNFGIFTQRFIPPKLIGCINGNSTDPDLNNLGLDVFYGEDPNKYSYRSRPMEISPDTQDEIPIQLILTRAIPMYKLTLENLESITIYEIPTKVDNPLDENYNNRYIDTWNACSQTDKLEELKTIPIVA